MFSYSKSGIPLQKMGQYLTSNVCVTISVSNTMLRFSMSLTTQDTPLYRKEKNSPEGMSTSITQHLVSDT
jgi:hypothetical protein